MGTEVVRSENLCSLVSGAAKGRKVPTEAFPEQVCVPGMEGAGMQGVDGCCFTSVSSSVHVSFGLH